MRKVINKAYVFNSRCPFCDETISIYFTLPDFGDAPILQKCKFCGTLYWHTPEDEAYIQPVEKQIEGKKCVKCGSLLNEALVRTHEDIKCTYCNELYSLDDDFLGLFGLDDSKMVDIEVYLLY